MNGCNDNSKESDEKAYHSGTINNKPFDGRLSIEELLLNGMTVRIKPQGYSMYPLFIPGRDEALIEAAKPDELKRGDIALYRRSGSILVLHRIFKITDDGFFMVGDNQTEIEGPLRPDQIRGRLTGFIRRGHSISTSNIIYRMISSLWLAMLPLRPFMWKLSGFVRKISQNFSSSK